MAKGKQKVKETSPYDKALADLKEQKAALRKIKREDAKTDRIEGKSAAGKKKKKKKVKRMLPRTAQESVPYRKTFGDGVFEISHGVYSKTVDFTDVNYQVARQDDRENIFSRWGECLNGFGADVDWSYTICNRSANKEAMLDSLIVSPIEGNEQDSADYNSMLEGQFLSGRNDIRKELYFTVAVSADSLQEASGKLNQVENDLTGSLAALGSKVRGQSTERRLEVLHDFFRPENIGEFHLDWNEMKAQGVSPKDYVAPFGLEFKKDYIVSGNTFYRCGFVDELPNRLADDFIHKVTNFSFPLICTVSGKSTQTYKAIRMVKRQITGMRANAIKLQQNAIKAGFDPSLAIPYELAADMQEAEELLQRIMLQDERMHSVLVGVIFSGKSLKELNDNQEKLNTAIEEKMCKLKILDFQQEEGMMQFLPLGHDVLPEKLRRTLTTESASVFIPFTSQELNNDNGVYLALNSVTKNIIRVNRKLLNNPNGFIFGESGSGKTFCVDKLIIGEYLSYPDKHIFIIDPENEYCRMVRKLGGQVVDVGVGCSTNINVCDMSINYSMDGDPIAEKSDFLMSVCETMARGLTAEQQSIVDDVVTKMYVEYIQNYDAEKLPTLANLYEGLKEYGERTASNLALSIKTYATGSLSIFAKKTNVDLNNRLICFNLSRLSKNLRSIGLLVVSELIWNKLCAFRNKISCSVYIDEFHLMFKNPTSEDFADQLFARIRKYGGSVTGITQNVDKLLQSEKARGMMGNANFTVMLSQSDFNRKILADMFSIGEEQLSYITNADKGFGLVRAGGVIVPFGDKFPKENRLYRYMTSDPDEIKKFDEEDERLRAMEETRKVREEQINKMRTEAAAQSP